MCGSCLGLIPHHRKQLIIGTNRTEDMWLMEEYTDMKKYKIAAVLMIIHGGFMELGGIFAMIPALLIGTDK